MFTFKITNKSVGRIPTTLQARSMPEAIDRIFGEGASVRLERGGSRYRTTLKDQGKVVGLVETVAYTKEPPQS